MLFAIRSQAFIALLNLVQRRSDIYNVFFTCSIRAIFAGGNPTSLSKFDLSIQYNGNRRGYPAEPVLSK